LDGKIKTKKQGEIRRGFRKKELEPVAQFSLAEVAQF
jgi:hypothetical protein